ncbi:zf-HC2 domain-containing protein [Acinetobacter guerrae]|uniref:zf-HC2 domain-containing protein n=1 Tax=Acinetobacter guerrae TaxID=1843371 RepID=UPI00125EF4A7|nr:zf-HC2 domain-containing protein [Acinetobacter guerrae]
MLTCRQATQLLSERQDRPLLFKEQNYLQFHLLICRSCRRYGKQMKTLSQISKVFRDIDVNGDETKDKFE